MAVGALFVKGEDGKHWILSQLKKVLLCCRVCGDWDNYIFHLVSTEVIQLHDHLTISIHGDSL